MRTLFADSGYWIALLFPRDQLHERAREVTLQLSPFSTVTTQMVLVEALNHLSKEGRHMREAAERMVGALEVGPGVEIVPQTDAQFRGAVERYASRNDQRWSLTDCASFMVMEERAITDALAYDRDFEQAGFVALLR